MNGVFNIINLELHQHLGNTRKLLKYRYLYLSLLLLPVVLMLADAARFPRSIDMDISLARASYLGANILMSCAVSQLFLIFFFGYELAAESISGERRNGNLDILLAITSERNIVLGKFQAYSIMTLFLVAASFPLFAVSYFLAGISLLQVTAVFSVLVVITLMLNGIALLCSTVLDTGRTFVPMAVSAGIILLINLLSSLHRFPHFYSGGPRMQNLFSAGAAISLDITEIFSSIFRRNEYLQFWIFTGLALLTTITCLWLSTSFLKKRTVFSLKKYLSRLRRNPRESSGGPPSEGKPAGRPPVVSPPEKTGRENSTFKLLGFFNPVFFKGTPFFPLRRGRMIILWILLAAYVLVLVFALFTGGDFDSYSPFITAMTVFAFLFAVFYGSSAFAEEKKLRMLDLFKIIPLSARSVIYGKVFSSSVLAALFTLFNLIIALKLVVQVRENSLVIFTVLLLSLIFIVFYAALGTLFSMLFARRRSASIVTLLLPSLLYLLGGISCDIRDFFWLRPILALSLAAVLFIMVRALFRLIRPENRKVAALSILIVFLSLVAAALLTGKWDKFCLVMFPPGLLLSFIQQAYWDFDRISLILISLSYSLHAALAVFLIVLMQSLWRSGIWSGKRLLSLLWRRSRTRSKTTVLLLCACTAALFTTGTVEARPLAGSRTPEKENHHFHIPADRGRFPFDVSSVALEVVLHPVRRSLEGTAVLELTRTAGRPTLQFRLLDDIKISSALVNGRKSAVIQRNELLEIIIPAEERDETRLTCRFEFAGDPAVYGGGGMVWSYIGEEGCYVKGSFPWFPAGDSYDSYTCETNLTVPRGYLTASQGAVCEISEVGGDLKTVHWKSRDPVDGVSVAAYPYRELKGEAGTIPVRVLLYPRSESNGRVYLELAEEILEFYESIFTPYPFEQFTVAEIESRYPGGYGSQTLVMLTGNEFAEDEPDEEFLAHEIAHQWAGNLVTGRFKTDNWLNEGLATYCQLLFVEHKYGRKRFLSALREKQRDYLSLAALDDRIDFPLTAKPADCHPRAFQTVIYYKGASVFHELRCMAGDERFKQLLRAFMDIFRWQVVTTDDFLDLTRQVLGQETADALRPWLEETGAAEIELSGREIEPTETGYAVTTTWQGNSPARGLRLPLLFSGRDGQTRPALLSFSGAERAVLKTELPFKPETVTVDPGGEHLIKAPHPGLLWSDMKEEFHFIYGAGGGSELVEAFQEELVHYFKSHRGFTGETAVIKDTALTESERAQARENGNLFLIGNMDNNLLMRDIAADLPPMLRDRWERCRKDSDGCFFTCPNPYRRDKYYMGIYFGGKKALEYVLRYNVHPHDFLVFSKGEELEKGFLDLPLMFNLEEEPRE